MAKREGEATALTNGDWLCRRGGCCAIRHGEELLVLLLLESAGELAFNQADEELADRLPPPTSWLLGLAGRLDWNCVDIPDRFNVCACVEEVKFDVGGVLAGDHHVDTDDSAAALTGPCKVCTGIMLFSW